CSSVANRSSSIFFIRSEKRLTWPLAFLAGAFFFTGFPGLVAFFIDSIPRIAPVFSLSLSEIRRMGPSSDATVPQFDAFDKASRSRRPPPERRIADGRLSRPSDRGNRKTGCHQNAPLPWFGWNS